LIHLQTSLWIGDKLGRAKRPDAITQSERGHIFIRITDWCYVSEAHTAGLGKDDRISAPSRVALHLSQPGMAARLSGRTKLAELD
jgi:hypothetical protein